jgi:site-specific recombinase XerD
MVDQGVHLRVIQEIMWHSDVRVTERYTHIASPAVREPRGSVGRGVVG